MSTCLHATRGVVRVSRRSLLSGSISRRVASPRPAAQCVSAVQVLPPCRSYASSKPPDSKSKKNPSNKPKPKPDNEDPVQSPPKVSEEDRKALWDLVNTATANMPRQYKADIEDAVRLLQQEPLPDELQELVDRYKASGKLTLADSMRVVRFTHTLQAKVVEMRKNDAAAGGSGASSTDQTSEKQSPEHQQSQNRKQKNEDSQKKTQDTFTRNSDKDSGSGGKSSKPMGIKWDTGTFISSAFVTYMLYRAISPGENTKAITWQEFRTQFLDRGLVERLIVMNGKRVKVVLNRDAVRSVYPDSPGSHANFSYHFTIGDVGKFEEHLDQAQQELQIPSNQRIPVSFEDSTPWLATVLSFGPTLLLIGGTYYLFRRSAGGGAGGGTSGIFGMGRSRAKKFNHETDIKVSFKDVAGMDEAKVEIMEFVSFLKEPGMYQKLGAKIPRGAILSGPPGTGKTLLAKATAGESKVPFFSVSGSEFVEMFVGVGASRVRDMFQTARKSAPCIIFIDEIDAIGKSRSKQNFSGGTDEREATLNQILTEMDGFNTSEQVVVLAGTNRSDVLDPALMRPGRFDRHISIDKPTMEGRKQIFAVHLKNIVTKVPSDFLQGRLAAMTPGFSGADIANCVNEAALIAARRAAESVSMEHFEAAIERVIGGLEKKSLVLNPEEKKTVAYHEAGHAICGWFFKWADPLLKVSIIPRGQGALGYAQYLPSGDTYLLNVNQLMDRMAMTLGGRVSEELHFDTVTSGASDDFNKVTRMATMMVTKWGMSDKVGYLYFEDDPTSQLHKPFSEDTARNIDMEVRRIVDEAYKQCRALLESKKKEIGIVAEELLNKEMLGREDLIRLLGPRPFEDKSEFTKYFGSKGDREGVPGSTPDTNLPGALPLGGGVGPTPVIFQQQQQPSDR